MERCPGSKRLGYWLLTALLSAGCGVRGAPVASAPATGTSSDGSPTSAAAGGDGVAPAGDAKPDARGAGLPLPGGEEPTPNKALPELRVEALGMHIGGGRNDADEKAPFHRALERRFPAFLECYRLVEDPWAGGSFGIDIKIPRPGGKPSLEQPRTKMRGAGFKECMVAAVGSAEFERPKAGPTVISYSVRFTLGGAQPKP